MADAKALELTFEIKEMIKIKIGKGDILAIQSKDRLTADGRAQLIKSVESFLAKFELKNVPILVLDPGLSVIVVHREDGT